MPQTQYARKGDAHIAYQIVGAGEASPMAELFAATYPERTSALSW